MRHVNEADTGTSDVKHSGPTPDGLDKYLKSLGFLYISSDASCERRATNRSTPSAMDAAMTYCWGGVASFFSRSGLEMNSVSTSTAGMCAPSST